MVEARALRPLAGPAEKWGMLCPENAPVIRGSGNVDFLCHGCGASLIEKVHERQLFDLAIRCPHCAAESVSEARPPGCPLAGRPVLIPAGKYRLSGSLDLPGPVMMAGQQAIDGYIHETRARWGMASGRADSIAHRFDPDGFNGLADDLVALLGDRHEKLLAGHMRGLASPTPPRTPNRILELVDYARKTAVALEEHVEPDRLELDGDLMSELWATVSMFHRWRFHPAWSALVASLTNPTEVQHSVMTLLVASYLVDSGNGVGIVTDGAPGRISDLWAQPTVVERLDLEVKTPLDLRGPRERPINREEAIRLVERLFNEAASSSRGQLDPTQSGLLAVGGYHLGPGGIETLEKAAEEVLRRQKDRKPHVVGIIVCEASYVYETTPAGMSMTPVMHQRLVQHPGYSGGLDVRDRPDARLGDLSQEGSIPAQRPLGPNREQRRRQEREARRKRKR
ncbi:MAG: hypothetical protein LC808_33275 [Actinobacteria bacterium]|nr:hypothetical protein [Actinomycetota bacterium]